PLPDRQALSAWLDGSLPGVSLENIADGALEGVDPGTDRVGAISVSPGDPAITAKAPGVYPLAATFTSATGTATATSVMIVPEGDGPEVGIGVIVPITAGPLEAGLLSSD